MPKVLIYNNDTNTVETYDRKLNAAMPYVTNNTLTVGEFIRKFKLKFTVDNKRLYAILEYFKNEMGETHLRWICF